MGFDGGAKLLKAVHDVFVAAVDAVHIPKRGAALGAEHRDEDDSRGAKRRRADNFCGFQISWPFDRNAMRVVERCNRPETVELGARLRELTEDSWIEFYEMLTPEKAIELG